MAVTQVYTAVPNDVITAARWNNEFSNIYNNGTSIAFPLTSGVSFAGYTITLDSAGVSTVASSSSQALNLSPGVKAGTPNTTGKAFNIASATFTDSNTAGSGTASSYVCVSIQQPTLAATNSSVTTTDAASFYIANAPTNGTNETITNAWALWVDAGATRLDGNLRVDGTLLGTVADGGHIYGLISSNNAGDATNDIDITVGEAASVHATPASRVKLTISTALTKRLDASWVTGTNQGGLSSSLTISNTDYFIHAIRVGGVDDIGFDTSYTAANLVTDHSATHYRPIGWIKRSGGAIVAFKMYEEAGGGVRYLWTTPTLDVDISNGLTTARRLDAVKVPVTGTVVTAQLRVIIDDAALFQVIITNPDETDTAPSTTAAPGFNVRSQVAGVISASELHIRTNTSGQIAARAAANTMDSYRVVTYGFMWSRR